MRYEFARLTVPVHRIHQHTMFSSLTSEIDKTASDTEMLSASPETKIAGSLVNKGPLHSVVTGL